MYGTDKNRIATYARKLTEIQVPGMHYNTAPLARGGRTDIIGQANQLVPAPGNIGGNIGYGGNVPGQVYGTDYDESIPLGTSEYDDVTGFLTSSPSVPYTLSEDASPSAENVWEIGTAESYCQYPDQVMPFDVSIMGSNEYGQLSVGRIYGVELLNMGMSISTDDLDLAATYTYIATSFVDFHPIWWDPMDDSMALNRFLTFGAPGELSVGGVPGQEVPPWAKFLNNASSGGDGETGELEGPPDPPRETIV